MSNHKLVKMTIQGEPASKANSRKMVYNARTGKPMFIRSQKARTYEKNFHMQCQKLDPLITSDVEVWMTIYYATRRPDLDESLILDCMQGYIYANDRQVKRKIIVWGIDRENPRAEIEVREIETGKDQ